MAHVKDVNGASLFPNFPISKLEKDGKRASFLQFTNGGSVNRAITYLMMAMNGTTDKINKAENVTVRASAKELISIGLFGTGKGDDVFVYSMPTEFDGGTYTFNPADKMVDVMKVTRKALQDYADFVMKIDAIMVQAEADSLNVLTKQLPIIRSAITAINPQPVYDTTSTGKRGKRAGGVAPIM